MQEMTQFVDVLPTTSMRTALAVVRSQLGKPETLPPKREIALAVVNFTSYGANQFIPVEGPTPFSSSVQELTLTECEIELAKMVPSETGLVPMEKIGDGTLLKIFQTVLPILLKLIV